MTDRIMTEHPQGKKGVNIARDKYETIRENILDILKNDELTYTQLAKTIEGRIGDSFEGSISWYTETVKLDLEAKGLIERVPDTKPQMIRLKG